MFINQHLYLDINFKANEIKSLTMQSINIIKKIITNKSVSMREGNRS